MAPPYLHSNPNHSFHVVLNLPRPEFWSQHLIQTEQFCKTEISVVFLFLFFEFQLSFYKSHWPGCLFIDSQQIVARARFRVHTPKLRIFDWVNLASALSVTEHRMAYWVKLSLLYKNCWNYQNIDYFIIFSQKLMVSLSQKLMGSMESIEPMLRDPLITTGSQIPAKELIHKFTLGKTF